MPKIKIDDLEYNTEDLSERGLDQLRSLQFVETQMLHLQKEIAVYQTAQSIYLHNLKAEVEELGIKPSDRETNEREGA